MPWWSLIIRVCVVLRRTVIDDISNLKIRGRENQVGVPKARFLKKSHAMTNDVLIPVPTRFTFPVPDFPSSYLKAFINRRFKPPKRKSSSEASDCGFRSGG